MKDLEQQCRLMCNNAQIPSSEKLQIFYIDTDNEKIAIQDDSDLQMAYALAITSDKRVKFMIETPNCSTKACSTVFNSPQKICDEKI